MIRPTLTFAYETRDLQGEIRAELPKPGVVRCRHKPSSLEILPEVPLHALLMPEWLMRPGVRHGIYWEPCKARSIVGVEGDSVVFHVTSDQTGEWEVDFKFRFTPGPDYIDFSCTMFPSQPIDAFEFFFASYTTETLESTWISANLPNGESFEKLDNRNTPPWGPPYFIPRDNDAREQLHDGRWSRLGLDGGGALLPGWCFARPILVAMQEATGIAAVTLVDPAVCTLLGGQHHAVETAHDFTFGADLRPDEPFVGRARIVIREIGRFPHAVEAIDGMWAEFLDSLP